MRVQNIEIGKLILMINSLRNSFTKSEKRIADAIIDKPEKVIYSSITDFAEMADVGESTTIRFCKKLGFKGYQGFKMVLAQELSLNQNESSIVINEDIEEKDPLNIVSQKLYNTQVSVLKETLSLLSYDTLQRAVDIINESSRIHFYGVGASSVTALDAKYKFMRIGLDVDCFMDGHLMAMDASLLNSEDVAIGISFSGSTKDIVDTLKIAKENGAKTISLTHHAKSPVTKYSDIYLLTGGKEGPFQSGASSTKVAQLFLLDIIYTEVFRKNNEKSILCKKKTGEAIENKLF